MEHEVTNMKDILSRAQKYIQVEEATRNIMNYSIKYETEISHKTQGHNEGHDIHELVNLNPLQSQI